MIICCSFYFLGVLDVFCCFLFQRFECILDRAPWRWKYRRKEIGNCQDWKKPRQVGGAETRGLDSRKIIGYILFVCFRFLILTMFFWPSFSLFALQMKKYLSLWVMDAVIPNFN